MPSQCISEIVIPVQTSQTVGVHAGSAILGITSRHGSIVLSTLSDPTQPIETRHIEMYHAGECIEQGKYDRLAYLGSVERYGGTLTYYVFERYRQGADHG